MKLTVVTGMVDPSKTAHLWGSWRTMDPGPWGTVIILNGEFDLNLRSFDRLQTGPSNVLVRTKVPRGPVRAFAQGVQIAAGMGADLIACLHDDLRIDALVWARTIEEFFEDHPACVLAGFGGAYGVGSPSWDYSERPENGDQLVAALARHDFISNMQDAEAHGLRIKIPQRVAVLDGFSLIGRASFMAQAFEKLERAGLVHHGYDTAISLMTLLERQAHEVWMLPIPCHHHGGMSAVAMPQYHEALRAEGTSDAEQWMHSHTWLYGQLGKSLPRLPLDVRR